MDIKKLQATPAKAPPRILVLGVEKIGKTSFACGSRVEDGVVVEYGRNSPVVIPVIGEEGVDNLPVAKFPPVRTYSEIVSNISDLFSQEHEFKTVVLDSASALAHVIADDVCQEYDVENIRKVPGFRTGEAGITQRWRSVLQGMDALRTKKKMAVIVIGHVKVRKHKNPEGDDWDCFDMDIEMPEVPELLKRWADLILFCNTKTVVKKEGEDTKFAKAKRRAIDIGGGARYLYTKKSASHPGGGRDVYGKLPYEIPLSWESFEAELEEINKK